MQPYAACLSVCRAAPGRGPIWVVFWNCSHLKTPSIFANCPTAFCFGRPILPRACPLQSRRRPDKKMWPPTFTPTAGYTQRFTPSPLSPLSPEPAGLNKGTPTPSPVSPSAPPRRALRSTPCPQTYYYPSLRNPRPPCAHCTLPSCAIYLPLLPHHTLHPSHLEPATIASIVLATLLLSPPLLHPQYTSQACTAVINQDALFCPLGPAFGGDTDGRAPPPA